MKKKNFFIGASALLLMAGMNFTHALNEYGFLDGNLCASILAQTTTTGTGSTSTGGTGGSTSTGSSSSTGTNSSGSSSSNMVKIKTYRKVPCNYMWTCTFDGSGTVTINGITVDIEDGKLGIKMSLPIGKKETCTGGFDWYDCDGIQTECVASL